MKLGIDLYSIRSQGWSPFECLDYCASLKVQVVHFSETRFLGGLEEEHLRRVRAHAQRLGLEIEVGMLSICPRSNLFDATRGTAEEQLARMIAAATITGSPIVRAVVGNRYDRWSGVPIEAFIEDTLRVLRAVRSRALDAGIKIAMENHGGDMRASELKMLIEEAGADFVGACLDCGNLIVTLDLPVPALDLLAPYVLTSHVRDGRIWRTTQGAAAQWVRMGAGNVGIKEFLRRYVRLCPGKPVSLEVMAIEPRYLEFLAPPFWDSYRSVPAWEFAQYLEAAERGTAPPPELVGANELEDLERDVRFCRDLPAA